MLLRKKNNTRLTAFFIVLAVIVALAAPENALAASRRQDIGDKLVVVIDPGHGGANLGTVENGHEEKSMTMITAYAMYEELLLYEGVEVYLTRTEDKDMTLKERALYAESVEADFLFSIHYNASESHDAYGSEVWVPMHPPYSGYGYQFGYEALTNFQEMGLLVRGVKTRPGEKNLDYYGILRESVALEIPAVIIEHCHVDEAHDEGFCNSDEKLRLLGRMDAAAVARYFGLKSSTLNVDYSGHPLADIGSEEELNTLLNARTAPETCQIQFVDADYEQGTLTLSVSGSDRDSGLLYYSYSIDGGETFSPRETWPGSNGLSRSYQRDFILNLDIPPGLCPEVVVLAYNGFDIHTESNHYESPVIFPFPGEESPGGKDSSEADSANKDAAEEAMAATVEFKDLDIMIAVVVFTIALVLTMMLVVQVVEAGRRKKRRQRYYQSKNKEYQNEIPFYRRRDEEARSGKRYDRHRDGEGQSETPYYRYRNEETRSGNRYDRRRDGEGQSETSYYRRRDEEAQSRNRYDHRRDAEDQSDVPYYRRRDGETQSRPRYYQRRNEEG